MIDLPRIRLALADPEGRTVRMGGGAVLGVLVRPAGPIAWTRDYYQATHPHSGYGGGYTNFMARRPNSD